ncbi:MAG: hypothetical protein AAFN41_09995, partial [Planctomycetota bacterium]
KSKPTRTIDVFATYCDDLLAPSTAGVGQDLEVRVGGSKLDKPVVVHFSIHCTGSETCSNVRMKAVSRESDRILSWNFYVDEEVKCRRMKLEKCEDREIEWSWEYMNPEDVIDLVLLVSPCHDATCVNLELDAAEVTVRRLGMARDCQLCL